VLWYTQAVKKRTKTKRLILLFLHSLLAGDIKSLNVPTKEKKLAVVGIGYMFLPRLCNPPSSVSSNHHIIKADPAASRRKLRAGYASVVALGSRPNIYSSCYEPLQSESISGFATNKRTPLMVVVRSSTLPLLRNSSFVFCCCCWSTK